jgi:hypothetical protein
VLKTPAGLTSSIKAAGKSFILQTEFIASPESVQNAGRAAVPAGRIITTVAVQGQVVHRVEKIYNDAFDDEEKFAAAEKSVKVQHISLARIVAARAKEFLTSVSEITVSPEDRLGLIQGVAHVTKIDFTEVPDSAPMPVQGNPIFGGIRAVRDLVIAISQNTRLGKLQKAVGAIEDKKFLLTGYGGSTFLLDLRDDANVSAVIKELEKVKG